VPGHAVTVESVAVWVGLFAGAATRCARVAVAQGLRNNLSTVEHGQVNDVANFFEILGLVVRKRAVDLVASSFGRSCSGRFKRPRLGMLDNEGAAVLHSSGWTLGSWLNERV
jgi:hypothetical protein